MPSSQRRQWQTLPPLPLLPLPPLLLCAHEERRCGSHSGQRLRYRERSRKRATIALRSDQVWCLHLSRRGRASCLPRSHRSLRVPPAPQARRLQQQPLPLLPPRCSARVITSWSALEVPPKAS